MILKKLLIGATSVFAFAAPAFAQDSPRPNAPDNVSGIDLENADDVIVVTGTALNRKAAIDEKWEDSRTTRYHGIGNPTINGATSSTLQRYTRPFSTTAARRP